MQFWEFTFLNCSTGILGLICIKEILPYGIFCRGTEKMIFFKAYNSIVGIICDPLPVMNHANIIRATGHHFGVQVVIECDPGYELSETSTVCQANGSWSNLPRCLRKFIIPLLDYEELI